MLRCMSGTMAGMPKPGVVGPTPSFRAFRYEYKGNNAMIPSSHLQCFLVAGLTALMTAGVSAAELATPPKQAAQHFSFTGKRPTFHEDNIEKIEVVVSAADSEGRMSLVESYWLPAFSVDSHYHKGHAETFYIISGKVEWTIGGITHAMGPGDAVHIPPNTVHSVKTLERMHSLMIYQNGGYEDQVAFEAALTPKQRKDPKIEALLTQIGDFHRAGGPTAVPPARAGYPTKGSPVFSFRGQRGSFEEPNVENVELVLTSVQSEGRLSMIESHWLPGFAAPPHYHAAHAETFYVLDGQVEWTVGGEKHVLNKGDAVHIPPRTLHSVKVVGGGKMHSLMLWEPGGFEENVANAASYSAEERKDPRLSERLMRQGDFRIMGQPGATPVATTKRLTILLIGASGMIGSRVLAEASSRGHQVIAAARNPGKIATLANVRTEKLDATDAAALAALPRDVDVIVSATSPRGGGNPMTEAQAVADALIAAAKANGKRLFIVGGAGSLSFPDGRPVAESLPDRYRSEALAMRSVLDRLKASDIDWTFFSPASAIAPGERTGKYRLGTTTLLSDARGESRISAEDYAHALVNELESPAHIRKQMTIAY